MEKGFSWECPFCNKASYITEELVSIERADLHIQNSEGKRGLYTRYIVCPNHECRKFTLTASLHEIVPSQHGRYQLGQQYQIWRLVPPSLAKVFPDYVPEAILNDYKEACVIRDLSPKSSATLARRCLQGMIRDFWSVKIKSGKLSDEIKAIQDRVDPDTWQAIDGVRSIGNIGAHMEKDINVIVDVEPNEAQLLIGLIELLIKDWYISREERKLRLVQIQTLAKEKQVQRTNGA
jgi:hypothetical protein